MDKTNSIKGSLAEKRFKEWLEKHNIPYFYIKQDLETFSPALKGIFLGKRPDFMVLIPNFGFIFVDVKYKNINSFHKKYPIDSLETKKYSSLQRIFNLHIWYVISNEEFDFKTWLWIPVSKVLESGIPKYTSSVSKEDFFAVPPENFIQIADNDSLERIFSKMLD